jgi:diguanylate cyclase (GGDEF)-like protein/PAS domain S-box-containing protein
MGRSSSPICRRSGGARFEPGEALRQALAGSTVAELSVPDRAENVYETGLAGELLEVYVPVRDDAGGAVVGAYEVYLDAAPIRSAAARLRGEVFGAGILAAGLLVALILAGFAGTSARLLLVNRRLRELSGQVRRSEARFRSLVQNAGDVVAVLDARGRLRYASPAVTGVLGHRAEDLTPPSMARLIHPADGAWARRTFVQVARRPGAQRSGETRVRHADGSWRTMEWTLINLVEDPGVSGVVLNARDISPRKALEQQLVEQALHDPLTGLANRALFTDRVEHALARRPGRRRGVAVLLLDLDDFKVINASLGHGIGDQVLAAVAQRLRAVIPAGDTVARMGGDEFAILLEEAEPTQTPAGVAERVFEALREPVVVGPRSVTVDASIGIAWAPRARRADASALLRDADLAMYAAKRSGKHRFEVFETGMHAAAVKAMELRADLDRAIDGDELTLHYQPMVDLADGRVVAVEALARWEHPARGLLAPEWFIRPAEESGQIVRLGRWVLSTAVRQAAEWRRVLGLEVPMAVNLSARELQEPGLVEFVGDILGAAGLGPGALTVEITETVWVEEAESSAQVLAKLHEMGVGLAIDDFGIGYSSLGYLQRHPFDSLKIDRSFIASLARDPSGEALVRSMVELGRRLGRTVVAEGIERAAQLAALQRLGCPLGQGHLFARPAPAAAIEPFLRRSAARASANGRRAALDGKPVRATDGRVPGTAPADVALRVAAPGASGSSPPPD